MVKKLIPQQDTGWGLIFRLNDLWREVEKVAPKGEYDQWSFKLDRIWCNLLYRNELDIKTDENKKITSIKLSDEDFEIKEFLDNQIHEVKSKLKKERKVDNPDKSGIAKIKREYYNALMLKDIWLRKFMRELGLYLKEMERDPSKAIYGGAG